MTGVHLKFFFYERLCLNDKTSILFFNYFKSFIRKRPDQTLDSNGGEECESLTIYWVKIKIQNKNSF